jgi:hypothetical protein
LVPDQGDRNGLSALARSILDILIDVASFITVPRAHVKERRCPPSAIWGSARPSRSGSGIG